MYDIIIGRDEKDRKKFGDKGLVYIGKHYVKMGATTSLSSKIYLDVARSHVVFVCGKRGGGKSYTMGVIAEGISDLPDDVKKNLSFVILDTMGVYWTMKYPNKQDEKLLEQWGLKAKGLDVAIYTPKGYYKEFKEKGIPSDYPFSISPSELDPDDWCRTFNIELTSPIGVLIERTILSLKDKKTNFSIKEIIDEIKKDKTTEETIKNAAINRFINADRWGIFDKKATKIEDIVRPGQVSVLDMSCYATMPSGWEIKALVLGIVSKRLFIERMIARRKEEFNEIKSTIHYFTEEEQKQEIPLVWLIIDEAHEFLPNKGKTTASDSLITILREGRQPGISLILASQQPGKIHTDVMTQSDIVISHRITAKIDTDALTALSQTYMRRGIVQELDNLPRIKGAAIIFDDTNERVYPVQIRPRFTWHGGSAPTAVKEKKKFGIE